MRSMSRVAPDWWDYTTLDREILDAAARITIDDLPGLCRDGFAIRIYDTVEEFYTAEALEYVSCWQRSTERVSSPGSRSIFRLVSRRG